MAGYVGEFLRELTKSMGTKAGEEGGTLFLERVKKTIAEERENIMVFIGKLNSKGGDYQRAAETLIEAKNLRQNNGPRPYGDHRRYPPGSENRFMNALALMSAVVNEPPKPEKPQPTGGGQQQQQQGGRRGQQQRRQ
ncbi:MAG: hypothetical protein HYS88_00315, partial [Candidatus Colwellbacteria bacterium]|nr:hypothetical protein [Candidatus Colwellbacteria bacterium]